MPLERCLFCRGRFQPNQVLEHLPVGHRFAYDPERGRLWMICTRCAKWSLVPIELRWEAVEELETLTRAVGRAANTDGMALVTNRGVRVLRVGRAGRREEAWWRYGHDLRTRRRVRGPFVVAGAASVLTAAGMLSGLGLSSLFLGYVAVGIWPLSFEIARLAVFGGTVWRGRVSCRKCGVLRERLGFGEVKRMQLVRGGGTGEVALRLLCRRCNRWSLRLKGLEAQHVLVRALAHHNFFGAPRRRVEEAADLIEEAGSGMGYLAAVSGERRRLRQYTAVELVALEMAVTDAAEAKLAAMSLEEQRKTWEVEEQLACIIDGELTPLHGRL